MNIPHGEQSTGTLPTGKKMEHGKTFTTHWSSSYEYNRGKKPYPTAAILDSQTSKTTECAKNNSPCGYDAGKKIKGRKRHILVDTLGLIIATIVHSAGIQDRDGGRYVLGKAKTKEHKKLKVWVDGGYTGKLIIWAKDVLDYDLEVVKRSDINKHVFKVLPKRWIVERTLSWLSRYRRLSKDYEYATSSEQAFIHLAMIRVMLLKIEKECV